MERPTGMPEIKEPAPGCDPPRPCGALAWDDSVAVDDPGLYCTGEFHHRGRSTFLGPCPIVEANRVRERVRDERKRLRGLIQVLELCGSGFGWRGFDVSLNPSVKQAHDAMVDFGRKAVAGGSPRVLLQGATGLGKTRLLLASHLGLLERGVDSRFVTARELRELGVRSDSKFTEAQDEANAAIASLLSARALHLDDLGEIEDDTRARGSVAAVIKHILGSFGGALAVTTNRTSEEAAGHVDLGGTTVSRLLANATVVQVVGADYRASTARGIRE